MRLAKEALDFALKNNKEIVEIEMEDEHEESNYQETRPYDEM